MRRRWLFLLAIAALASGPLALIVSCSFPDVMYREPGGEAGGATSDSPVGTGDGGATPEAAPPINETSDKPDTGACIDPCDCDKDGARSRNGGCGGGDCDDDDSRAKPNQNFRKDLATNDTRGDWNCDGTTERLYKSVNVKCTGLIGDTCPGGREGLASDLPCGATGEYITCAPGGLGTTCNKIDGGLATQECR